MEPGVGIHVGCQRADLVGRRVAWLLWGVPSALLLLGLAWQSARPWLFTPSLAVAGCACLVNAARCGRLHCFITGPLFLLGALVALLNAVGVVAVDERALVAAVAASIAFGYGLEWACGKYVAVTPTVSGGNSE